MVKVKLIAAFDQDLTVGHASPESKSWNGIPWYSPSDLAHFKEKTFGQAILIGRKTFQAMKSKGLPGRLTVVLTRAPAESMTPVKGVAFCNSFEEALAFVEKDEEIRELWVAGGVGVWKAALATDLVEEAWLTSIAQAGSAENAIKFPMGAFLVAGHWACKSFQFTAEDVKHPRALITCWAPDPKGKQNGQSFPGGFEGIWQDVPARADQLWYRTVMYEKNLEKAEQEIRRLRKELQKGKVPMFFGGVEPGPEDLHRILFQLNEANKKVEPLRGEIDRLETLLEDNGIDPHAHH